MGSGAGTTGDEDSTGAVDAAASFRTRLARGGPPGDGLERLDDPEGSGPDLTQSGVKLRVESARDELRKIVADHLGGAPDLLDIVDEMVRKGGNALRILEANDQSRLRSGSVLRDLEVIVRTDGSRPSFMVREGAVDLSTSPVGLWQDTFDVSAELLSGAMASVGRIDDPAHPQGFRGTGFLVHPDLIVTNRHVLQEIINPDGSIREGIGIDFGHEFRARGSIGRRPLESVAFKPPKRIVLPIDHSLPDIALIRLGGTMPTSLTPLSLDIAPDWAGPRQPVFTVGYPASPAMAERADLLEKLFQSTFGCKRIAPGLIMESTRIPIGPDRISTAHDATTLGGNSGSVVLVVGREHSAAGLHYGGSRREPRENFVHPLGLLRNMTNADGDTLEEVLRRFEVRLIDRNAGH